MHTITIYNPDKLVFGTGCFSQFIVDIKSLGKKRLYIVTLPHFGEKIRQEMDSLAGTGITFFLNDELLSEPGFSHFYQYLEEAVAFKPDGIIGIGGGSVLDMAKLLAALIDNDQKLEAYTNQFAHPMVDLYALEGIRLISMNLVKACADELPARTAVSLGSLYGGMCLGPVNTTAVHALSYPLGSEFKIAHGLANALLLPYVMEYNLVADPERFQQVALALGAGQKSAPEQTALEGVAVVRRLMKHCKLPSKLSAIGIPADAIPEMAASAVKIQRLMKNNIRVISVGDAIEIYQNAY